METNWIGHSAEGHALPPVRAFERTPAATLPASGSDRQITRPEALDLLYAVIEGAGSYLNAYTYADGERLASALRSTFRIVEQTAADNE